LGASAMIHFVRSAHIARFERFARHHPWVAAAVVAMLAAIISGLVAAITGQREPVLHIALPIGFAAWLLLGGSYRAWSRSPM